MKAVVLCNWLTMFAERKFRWYYEGVGGWWEYDERTSIEIEKYHQSRREDNVASVPAAFELLIAGFIYIIDLDNRVQYRRGVPTRRRRIKRDLAGIPDCKVGVAGINVMLGQFRNFHTAYLQSRD